jgi:hypothetical protein
MAMVACSTDVFRGFRAPRCFAYCVVYTTPPGTLLCSSALSLLWCDQQIGSEFESKSIRAVCVHSNVLLVFLRAGRASTRETFRNFYD